MNHREAKARTRTYTAAAALLGTPGVIILVSLLAKGAYAGSKYNCVVPFYGVCAATERVVSNLYYGFEPFSFIWHMLPQSRGFAASLFSAPGLFSVVLIGSAAVMLGNAQWLRSEIRLAATNAMRTRMEESLGGGSKRQSIGTVTANGDVTITQAIDR